MARVPSEDATAKLVAQSKAEEEAKRAEQKAEGKDFVNHGQGVIPEEDWKNLPGKKETNEETE